MDDLFTPNEQNKLIDLAIRIETLAVVAREMTILQKADDRKEIDQLFMHARKALNAQEQVLRSLQGIAQLSTKEDTNEQIN